MQQNTEENNDDVQERKVFDKEKKDGLDIKKEDESAECDICQKVFRTAAVSQFVNINTV